MNPLPFPSGGTRQLGPDSYETVLLAPNRKIVCIGPSRLGSLQAAFALYAAVKE